jgi:hypothetical protein
LKGWIRSSLKWPKMLLTTINSLELDNFLILR